MMESVNVTANMLRSKIFVCPVCGNILHSLGDANISCHGIQLEPQKEKQCDETHFPKIEIIEDEYYVQIDHEMTREHNIAFIAAVSMDRLQFVKLYPEGNAEVRFKKNGVRKILFYCNKDGLFYYPCKLIRSK